MTEDEAKTKWKPVYGYSGLYEVNNFGQVRSVARLKPYRNGFRRISERILSPTHVSGYPRVLLWCLGRAQSVFVHRLVAEAFIGPCPSPTHQVNHKDGNRADPRAANLEWVTPSENQAHSYRELGRRPVTNRLCGKANGRYVHGRRSLAGAPK